MARINHVELNSRALYALLDFFNGNKSQMALAAGVSRNTVGYWFRRGQMGKPSAMMIDKNKKVPFTKEQLRSDILYWDKYQQK